MAELPASHRAVECSLRNVSGPIEPRSVTMELNSDERRLKHYWAVLPQLGEVTTSAGRRDAACCVRHAAYSSTTRSNDCQSPRLKKKARSSQKNCGLFSFESQSGVASLCNQGFDVRPTCCAGSPLLQTASFFLLPCGSGSLGVSLVAVSYLMRYLPPSSISLFSQTSPLQLVCPAAAMITLLIL